MVLASMPISLTPQGQIVYHCLMLTNNNYLTMFWCETNSVDKYLMTALNFKDEGNGYYVFYKSKNYSVF